MIRKVSVQQLKPGMYVNHIPLNWFAHPFWRTSFTIRSDRDIDRLLEAGVSDVLIDTSRGLDVDSDEVAPRLRQQSLADIDARFVELAEQRKVAARNSVSLEEERWRARYFQQDAMFMVQTMMDDARLGRPLDLGRTEPIIERIVDSVRRHPDALIPLLQFKEHETYTYQHALSVATMTIALGMTLRLEEKELLQAAQGALLQDIGTARISERVLNKATPLTDLEYLHVRSHVDKSRVILENTPGISDISFDLVIQHHERIDGTGYPRRLAGEAVSLHAQVAAIVDTYDALTSDRPYHGRVEPAAALSQLYGLAGKQLRGDLVQAFVKTLGVYPVGSLVRLDSGYLAIVVEQHRDNLLQPVVRTIYNIKKREYIQPELLDLGRRLEAPAIVSVESFAAWDMDPRRWQPS
jgi:HD-GYP domain-containing protein (c-di-GMP phosphodiesterase class II)